MNRLDQFLASTAKVFGLQRLWRHVQLGEGKDLHFSDGYPATKSVPVVISEERWTERRVQGGKQGAPSQQSRWMWVACQGLGG